MDNTFLIYMIGIMVYLFGDDDNLSRLSIILALLWPLTVTLICLIVLVEGSLKND